jgi:hypothetical protein
MENKPIEQLTSDEISNLMVEKEKTLQEYEVRDSEVTAEKYRIEKEIALLRIKLNDTKSDLARSDSNIKRIRSELRMLERIYWKNKRG